MEHTAPDQNVGSSVPFVAIFATVVALAVVIGGFYAFRTISGDTARQEIVIATGADGGTYHALGNALARVLKGTNVIESAFATVRLRQRVTKGAGSRAKGLTMAFKLLAMAEKRWRRIRSPHLVKPMLEGKKFLDGKPIESDTQEGQKSAA